MRRSWLGAPAAAVAIAVAGCGGHAATRADVIARGNAICTSAQSAIRALPPPRSASATGLAPYLRRVVPVVDREARQVARLPRPTDRRATLDAFAGAVASADRDWERAADAAAGGNEPGVTAALSDLRASRVAPLAARYGLTACTGTAATVS